MLKRGQAAMEFLMTYGWAILVVLIAIGALAYFGVLNPNRLLPRSCTVGNGISCDDFKICATGTSSGSAKVILRNGQGSDLGTPTITLTPTGGTGVNGAIAYATGLTSWADGSLITVTWADQSTAPTLATGSSTSKFKADLAVLYTPSGGIQHTTTGTITTVIEAAGGCT